MNKASLMKLLNRQGIRWLAAVGATTAETALNRKLTIVRPLPDRFFAHKHVDATLILTNVANRLTPAHLEKATRDIFCFRYTPKEGDTVVDIGAGYGEETLTFSRLVGSTGRVISVEAHPATYRRLVLNCKHNQLNNVTPLHFAVTDSDGVATIDEGTSELGSLTARIGQSAGTEVPSVTVDKLIVDYGLERIDLLKMNIEGAEQLAIRGMSQSSVRVRNAVISCHDFLVHPGSPCGDRAWFATYDVVADFMRDDGFILAGRRATDKRPWVQYYIYAERSIEDEVMSTSGHLRRATCASC
jgi:FkbM family methyltransferase